MHYHFFAYLSRMKLIRRWGLMRNAVEEDVAQHSWEVAVLAHALAVISRDVLGNDVDPNAWLTQALERIAQGWPNKNIDDLLPWNFKAK